MGVSESADDAQIQMCQLPTGSIISAHAPTVDATYEAREMFHV